METQGQETPADGSHEPPLDDYDKFVFELADASDRSAAVLAQALIEDSVRSAITEVLHGENRHSAHLVGDDDNPGVLGFSDQCRLAHCLGLVNTDELSDLLSIGRIRNRFGHSRKPLAFYTQSIKDRCDSLKTLGTDDDWSLFAGKGASRAPREKYLRCAFALYDNIHTRRVLMAPLSSHIRAMLKKPEFNPTSPDPPTVPQESPQ